MEILPIATFHSPFTSKFGIPKQSGVVEQLQGTIILEPNYRHADALRGIEDFDFLWLLWEFSANPHECKSLLVRPPRLGGNEKVGVFASRSPFRPNRLGLSSVRLSHIDWQASQGPIIHVLGGDLMEGTPIYDIKPYIAYADAHVDARSGFVDQRQWHHLKVELSAETNNWLHEHGLNDLAVSQLKQVLEEDPRPQYQNNPQKVYGMPFLGVDVHFKVADGVLTVLHPKIRQITR